MKKYIAIASLAVLAACGGNEKVSNQALDKLEQEREGLREQLKGLNEKIKSLDDKILASGGDQDKIAKAILVSTLNLTTQPFEHFFEVQGTIESDKNAVLTAEMGGVVKRILVKEGQNVRQGQIIAELDHELIEQNIAELQDNLNLAKFVFEKQDRLWKQNIGSELQFRQAKTTYEGLETRMKQLKTQRNKASISAPFSGIVEAVFPKVGELAGPGMPVARIVNLSDLNVKAEVSESYLGKVKSGNQVSVLLPATGKVFEAKINKIGSYINPSGRTFEIGVSLSNTKGELLPNQIAKIKVRDYVNKDAIVIPTKAILQDIDGNSFVYVVEKSNEVPKVKKQAVTMGLTYNNESEIVSGLSGTEEVVIDGVRSINNGDRISISNGKAK